MSPGLTARLSLGLLGALLAVPALADMVRIGNQVLKTGDSKMELLRVAGEPDERDDLETLFGGRSGERWYYTLEHNQPVKVVTFTIRDGRIVKIEEDLL